MFAEERKELSQAFLSGIHLLRVAGDIDCSTSPAFDEALREAFALDGRVLIDLSSCSYIDSGGLGVILTALKEVRGRGWLGVISPNSNVRRLLEICGLLGEESLLVFADEEQAARIVAAQKQGNSSRPSI